MKRKSIESTFDFCLPTFADMIMIIDTANVMSSLIEVMLEIRAIIVQDLVHRHRTVQVPFAELRLSIGRLNDGPTRKFNSYKNWALKFQP